MTPITVDRNQRLSSTDRELLGRRLQEGYASGTSIAKLASEHGTSAGRVRNILLDRGVKLRARGGDMRSAKARGLASE